MRDIIVQGVREENDARVICFLRSVKVDHSLRTVVDGNSRDPVAFELFRVIFDFISVKTVIDPTVDLEKRERIFMMRDIKNLSFREIPSERIYYVISGKFRGEYCKPL